MIYDISKITGDTRMTPVIFRILYVIYQTRANQLFILKALNSKSSLFSALAEYCDDCLYYSMCESMKALSHSHGFPYRTGDRRQYTDCSHSPVGLY